VFVIRGERTVKKLRLSKALTIPEGTAVSAACRRMAANRVDAVLLADAEGLLSGIVTDKVPTVFFQFNSVELSGFSVFGWLSLIWSLKGSSFLGSHGEHTRCFELFSSTGYLKACFCLNQVPQGSGFLNF
jgi:hypothetical protein